MNWLIISAVLIFGVIVGLAIPFSIPLMRDKVVSSVEEMEGAVDQLDQLNIPEIDLIQTVESIRNAKIVLLSLESGDLDSAKLSLIEEIGLFYFTYTHEDERELNQKMINELLDEIQRDSFKSQGLKAAIEFNPKD